MSSVIHFGPVWEKRYSNSFAACDAQGPNTMSTHEPAVTCEKCKNIIYLRARLSLEQRDEPKEGGANTWQDRDADEYGVPRTGPIE